MKKIGVFGGTFNPIHNGHIYLAKSAYKLLNLDKVLVIPSGFSYQKSGENVLSKYIRADMVKLAIKDYPYLEYSDIEVKKEGNSYTYSTILDLKEEYLDALNIFRGKYGTNYIYFFRYAPYKMLGNKINELSKYKDIYKER